MKKLTIWIVTAIVLLTFVSFQNMAATDPVNTSRAKAIAESEQARVILTRIDEINAMDKTSMTVAEKRALRKEVRASEKRLNDLGGGVYLSVGAVIIILLLLILLL